MYLILAIALCTFVCLSISIKRKKKILFFEQTPLPQSILNRYRFCYFFFSSSANGGDQPKQEKNTTVTHPSFELEYLNFGGKYNACKLSFPNTSMNQTRINHIFICPQLVYCKLIFIFTCCHKPVLAYCVKQINNTRNLINNSRCFIMRK